MIHNVDELNVEIRDGEELVVSEQYGQINLPGCDDQPERAHIDLVKISLAKGPTFTRQPDGTWLSDVGRRYSLVLTHFDENDLGTMATYVVAAW